MALFTLFMYPRPHGFTDIFTKCLSPVVFKEFHFSINVWSTDTPIVRVLLTPVDCVIDLECVFVCAAASCWMDPLFSLRKNCRHT